MTESTDPEGPTVEQRVDQLEQQVAVLVGQLDSALTANAVLQERYGALTSQWGALDARIQRVEAAP